MQESVGLIPLFQMLKAECSPLSLSGMLQKFRPFRPISLIFLTYYLLSYFVHLHCTNIHLHSPSFSFLTT